MKIKKERNKSFNKKEKVRNGISKKSRSSAIKISKNKSGKKFLEKSKKKIERRKTIFGETSAKKSKKKYFRRKTDVSEFENLSDSELVSFVMKKNPDAYKILFKRYEKSLYIYIFHMVRNKEEVEDLLQNVFAKTFKSLNRFDIERKFSSWIYRIAHNEAVNFIKRKSKRILISWEDVSTSKDKIEISVEAEDVAENFLHKEITKEVDDALEKIPEKYKKILMMRYFDEYSYDEMGKILGKPVNTVGTLISRAKKKLFEVISTERER